MYVADLADRAAEDFFPRCPPQRMPAAGMIDGENRPVLLASLDHAVRVADYRGDGFLADYGLNARLCTGDGDFRVPRRIRGYAYDVEFLGAEHFAPIGVRPLDTQPLGKSSAPALVPTRAGDNIDLSMGGQGRTVGAVEILDLLTKSVAGNLIPGADET